MNVEDTNAANDETFADDAESPVSQSLDQLDEKLNAILKKAKAGEADAIEQLRRDEEARLDKAL